MTCGIGLERFGHLHRQFPGGSQHQSLRFGGVLLKPLEQGEGECCRFARACLGLADQVAAQHQLGERCSLDR